MGIVVIGAVFVDIKGYPLSTYIPGGRNAGRIEQVHGGVSRNVAEDIANVELRPTFVGLVDDTGMGQDVIDKLDNHKVNTRYIQKVPDGMGTWLAIFDNDGDVHAAISKRPDTTPLTTLLEEKGDEIFKDCDAIAIELDLEKDTVKRVLRYAKKYNKKVFAAVSNMSIAMERRDYLQQIDCFVCNQQEAGLLGRLRASRPQPDGSGTGPERPQRQHDQHGGDHGRSGCRVRQAHRRVRRRTRQEGGRHRHHRRRRRLLCRYGHRPDLRQESGPVL